MDMYRRRLAFLLGVMAVIALGHTLSAQPKKGGLVGNGPFPSFIKFASAPEGVAVDKVGNVYVSAGTAAGVEVWKFSPSGQMSLLASLGLPAGGECGLAVDAEGNVYAAKKAGNTGVYRIARDGTVSLLPGTEAIVFPNALAFDPRGNLYITETFSLTGSGYGPGGIWRVPRGGNAELLMRHELLTGVPPHLLGFPAGANGISWHQGNLFVANTERAVVLKIPVLRDGSLAEPEVWAQVTQVPESVFEGGPFPVMLDGLALDVHGNVYLAVPSRNAVIRISAADRAQATVAVFPSAPLDSPLSLAFGTGKGDKQALFVTNGGMSGLFVPGMQWPGFGLVRVEVGVPGLPLP